jgi:arsenate reductase
VTAHWSIQDPAAVEGSDDAKRQAFEDVFRELDDRIGKFVS